MTLQENILSDLIINKVYSATTMYNETNARAKRINRSSWAILLKYEGETLYETKGKTYVSNRNKMVILPKGSSYNWICTKSGHYAVIEFESSRLYDKIIYFPDVNGDRLLKDFKELEYKRTVKKPLFEIESIRDAYSIILKLCEAERKIYVPTEKTEKLSPAIEYIAQNYHKNIKNDDLASLSGLSTVYFRKLFTEVYHISPIAYVHELRIKKAKEMLKSDYGSITDIAHSLGYLNIYDFSRDFKKHTGVSPSKYV
ncbi:MAG TPA: AraC family transcriptional regulator [Candidatus Eisenbergiella merdipullorum]|uniref:AraC family transcriptional regulator n=1 Tax=Candidatus Eisenbergiella merdipullorum TaxID=2838553 RepID=A0A9D2KZJ5_9FIRM|nr:AraC family transcriptional regulator [Candidatus Eisenbergiella merdipullorum]